ncbi:hypothetical protein SUGI_0421520 [Cryptomeria japonica]|nr:hypothetical protein SUGI_0421520 [Cryptomeria japonica]
MPHLSQLRVKRCKIRNKRRLGECRASMGSTTSIAASIYAKDMERIAAKESLFLAIKDAGGLDVIPSGKATDIERIDINERVIALERLNPTPRPTTSPFLEGSWRFQWFGGGSPGMLAANFLLETFPSALASIKELDLLIMDGYAKASAGLKLLSLVESNFILTTKLTIEGPLRMKEEYVEGVIEMPNVPVSSIPTQFKDTYGQVLNALEQLPTPLKETLSNGVKIPLSGTFERMFIISYLDDEMMIERDINGVASILSRPDGNVVLQYRVTDNVFF